MNKLAENVSKKESRKKIVTRSCDIFKLELVVLNTSFRYPKFIAERSIQYDVRKKVAKVKKRMKTISGAVSARDGGFNVG